MSATLPPFERFAQFRRYMGLAIHPGGDLLYTTDLTGQFNLWRQPIDARGVPGYPRQLTALTDQPVRDMFLPSDGRSVFYTADRDGDENHQIFRLWFDRGVTEPITDAPKSQHFLGGRGSLLGNGELVYADNERKVDEFDVVVKNLRTGAAARPFPTERRWLAARFDPSGRRIFAVDFRTSSDVRLFVLDRKRGSLDEVLPHDDDAIVAPVDWTADGRGVLVLTDIGSEFKQLVLWDVASGKPHVLAAPQADIEEAAHSRAMRTVAYAVNDGGYSTVYAGRVGTKFRRLRTPHGSIPIAIWSSYFDVAPNGKYVAALWGTGTAPPEILWIPLGNAPARAVTDGMVGGVPPGPVSPPQLVKIPGPGGRSIPAWYLRPKAGDRAPLPAVLSVHGGPHSQERPGWAYSGLYAFLNSRGIAVLAPNIRGSTGYGKSYQREIDRDWGGGPLEDLRACAEWLKQRPEIDPARLAVFGGSFGGFATLTCLTRLPEYWKVGVDIFGPSNLVTFLRTIPPSWKKGMTAILGDPDVDAARLTAHSPITYLDALRADLLVIQGGKDPRVAQAESDQLVERLRAAGRHVEYTIFPDEGHGFSRQANNVKAMRQSATFLVDHLTPRSRGA